LRHIRTVPACSRLLFYSLPPTHLFLHKSSMFPFRFELEISRLQKSGNFPTFGGLPPRSSATWPRHLCQLIDSLPERRSCPLPSTPMTHLAGNWHAQRRRHLILSPQNASHSLGRTNLQRGQVGFRSASLGEYGVFI